MLLLLLLAVSCCKGFCPSCPTAASSPSSPCSWPKRWDSGPIPPGLLFALTAYWACQQVDPLDPGQGCRTLVAHNLLGLLVHLSQVQSWTILDSLEVKVVEIQETIPHLKEEVGEDVESVGRTEWLRWRSLLFAFWMMLIGRELLWHGRRSANLCLILQQHAD